MKSWSFLFVPLALGAGMALHVGCSAGIETNGPGAGGGSQSAVVASSSGDVGGAGGESASASSGSSSSGSTRAPLGGACQSHEDCELGFCVTPLDDDPIFGGGAPQGICTAPCLSNNDCLGATCIVNADKTDGRCVPTCVVGPELVSLDEAHSPDKCLGRDDLRCVKINAGEVCLPTCGSDEQCGAGRGCDPRSAVCVDMPDTGAPLGAACTPNTAPSECAGLCIQLATGETMCSSPCVLGGDLLATSDCGGPSEGVCTVRHKSSGSGDQGFCAPSCSAHADCQVPSFWCFSLPGVTEMTQRGYCFVATPCPNGQDDCVDADNNPTGYACTATPEGAYCLDTTWGFDVPASPPP